MLVQGKATHEGQPLVIIIVFLFTALCLKSVYFSSVGKQPIDQISY